MQTVTTIGFDIAKSVFQVHGVDAAGQAAWQSSISSISGTRSRLLRKRCTHFKGPPTSIRILLQHTQVRLLAT